MQSKTEKELTEVLDRVFLVALLITGNMDRAEDAVLDGIAALDGTMSSDGFRLATLKSAIERGEQRSGEIEDIFPSLPLELRRILLLNPDIRACFVLRVLLGMPSETCSEVLQIPTQKIGHSVSDAMQQLAVLGSTTRTGYCRTSEGKSDNNDLPADHDSDLGCAGGTPDGRKRVDAQTPSALCHSYRCGGRSDRADAMYDELVELIYKHSR
jgi:hypothetical protein